MGKGVKDDEDAWVETHVGRSESAGPSITIQSGRRFVDRDR